VAGRVVLTTTTPPGTSPAVAFATARRESSRTTTTSGVVTWDSTRIGAWAIRLEAVTGAPRRSAPKDGAAVTPSQPLR